jgi:predicted nucleotidyltransferase
MATLSEIHELQIEIPHKQVAELCKRFGVSELAVFGSVLTDRFSEESDVDFLVAFQNDDYGPWACKLTQLQTELAGILSRHVDLVSRAAVMTSPNYIRREHILRTARILYVT